MFIGQLLLDAALLRDAFTPNFRLPGGSMLSRPVQNAFTAHFVRFEAQLSRTLLGVRKRDRKCFLIVNFYSARYFYPETQYPTRNFPLTGSSNVITSLSECLYR